MTNEISKVACTLCLLGWVVSVGAGTLSDGHVYKTERLADNIWRVRVSRDGAHWPESGMNRYGVIQKLPVIETEDRLDFGKVSVAVRLVGKGFEVGFPLAPDERVYGLGDASRDGLQRRPGSYEMFVENVSSYIPIPFAWTTKGWGVFVNSTWRHRFDIGSSDANALTISAREGEVDFYVFTGKGPRALLDAYTRVTGRPALLPIWGYGFTFVANQWIDQFALVDETMGFRDHAIPCDVMGLEPGWMEKFYDASTRKRWDSTRFYFPFWHPGGAITFPAAMARVGMKLSLWLCCNYDLFRYEEELASGTNIMQRAGVKAIWDDAADGADDGAWVDGRAAGTEKPTRPAAVKVAGAYAGDRVPHRYREGERPWFEHLEQFVDQGAQAFKLDGAYQVTPWNGVENRTWSNGMNNEEAHNLYPLVYGKQMSRGYEWYTGRRSMVYSAGGYAGLQQFVASWAGDTGGGVKPLISVLNLGLSGHPHQSCDMTVKHPTAAGLHFGFLMPWAQQNNWDYWDLPWVNPKEKVDTFRAYAELRYRLAPYLYSTAAEASRTGWPIARALHLDYPDDVRYANCTNTYLLGDHLLVGVYSPTVVIPPGRWYEWRTGECVVGPCELPVKADWQWGGALYVRAGAVIPMWPVRPYLDKGWNEDVECHVWPGASGSFSLYEDDGLSLGYRTGAGSRTALRLEHRTGWLFDSDRLVVGSRKGSYDGMPSARRFRIVIHDGSQTRCIDMGRVGTEGACVEW